MLILTEDAKLVCKHDGKVKIQPSQTLVRVEGRLVLVEPDPEGRGISLCPNYGLTIKPCVTTLKVKAGYSTLVRIGGKPVCLDTVEGLTDGTPPGLVKYVVRNAGQDLVAEQA